MRDYEQLYYDTYFKNKQLQKKIKELEQELNILKKYSKNGDVKSIIIKEVIRWQTNKT
ncbi:MAG: hypothetical protein VZS44_10905 [Bacilli bacterium]|nr:hypothetical protein [Bacilli bacterium]